MVRTKSKKKEKRNPFLKDITKARFYAIFNQSDIPSDRITSNDYIRQIGNIRETIENEIPGSDLINRVNTEFRKINSRRVSSNIIYNLEDIKQRVYLRKQGIHIFDKESRLLKEYTTFQGNINTNLSQLLLVLTKETLSDNPDEKSDIAKKVLNLSIEYLALLQSHRGDENRRIKANSVIEEAGKRFLSSYKSLSESIPTEKDPLIKSFNRYVLGITLSATYTELDILVPCLTAKDHWENIMRMSNIKIQNQDVSNNRDVKGFDKKDNIVRTKEYWTSKYYYDLKIASKDHGIYRIINMDKKKIAKRIFIVPSRTTPGRMYDVTRMITLDDEKTMYSCLCKGYKFSKSPEKTCGHIKEISEKKYNRRK